MEIIVHPNKKNTEIISQDNNRIILNVKAKAQNNKANLEVIRFLSKLYNKKVKIISGITNRKKIIKFY